MTNRHPKNPNPCSVCGHRDRARAELLLADGGKIAPIARKLGMSKNALSNHWKQHVSEERRAQLAIGPVQRAELAARLAEESQSLLDRYRALEAGLWQLYLAAVEAGDGSTGSLVAARLIACLQSIGRITGELAQSPLVQINQTAVIGSDPSVVGMLDRLVRVLRPYPEARAAVLAEVRTLEAPAALAPAVALPAPPGDVIEAAP